MSSVQICLSGILDSVFAFLKVLVCTLGFQENNHLPDHFYLQDYGKIPPLGGMTEWTKVPVLKTGWVQAHVGSNPTPSAGFAIQTPLGRCQSG